MSNDILFKVRKNGNRANRNKLSFSQKHISFFVDVSSSTRTQGNKDNRIQLANMIFDNIENAVDMCERTCDNVEFDIIPYTTHLEFEKPLLSNSREGVIQVLNTLTHTYGTNINSALKQYKKMFDNFGANAFNQEERVCVIITDTDDSSFYGLRSKNSNSEIEFLTTIKDIFDGCIILNTKGRNSCYPREGVKIVNAMREN